MRARISFTNLILLTAVIITGAIISITVSLTDTKAFSDKPDEKQIKETDNEMLINYQQMYKQYDFAKYLNYYYTYTNKEYTENDDSNNGAENSEINPFAATTFDNKLNEKDDNTKKQPHQHQQQQSNRGNEDAEKIDTIKSDRKDFADEKKYSLDKNDNDKKQSKNIKIIECRNFNINAYEVEDLKSIETLQNKPTTFENDGGNQQDKSHNENNRRGEANQYDINSNTKVIFICTNENHDLRPFNSNNFIPPLTNEGIIIPMHSQDDNNNDDKTATTISYAQYKKSIANDQN